MQILNHKKGNQMNSPLSALSRKRNGKLEKTIYSVKELFLDVLFQNAQMKF